MKNKFETNEELFSAINRTNSLATYINLHKKRLYFAEVRHNRNTLEITVFKVKGNDKIIGEIINLREPPLSIKNLGRIGNHLSQLKTEIEQ